MIPPFINRVGETNKMNCGMSATIIAYRSTSDIDIKFEDGTIIRHKRYDCFKKGTIYNHNQLSIHVGEIRVMNNGLQAKIVAYRNNRDIDVQFDDGQVVTNKSYQAFRRGQIGHPFLRCVAEMSLQEFAMNYYLQNLGFRKIKKGEWQEKGFGQMELDFYHDNTNIAIEQDGGVHRMSMEKGKDSLKNKRCEQMGIKLYRIKDPRCGYTSDNAIEYVLSKEQRVAVGLFDCKKELEDILSQNNIEYEDSFIDFYRDKEKIITAYNKQHVNSKTKFHIGEKSWNMRANQNMTIIQYFNSENIAIKFDDGTIREKVRYDKFKKGCIAHPSQTYQNIAKQRIGEARIMNCGLKATIINYRNASDIDVQFENGNVRCGVSYRSFCLGQIAKQK